MVVGGHITTWNKGIASEIASLVNEEDDKVEDSIVEVTRSPSRHSARTHKLNNERKKRQEYLMKLVAKRDNDQTQIRDRAERMRTVRGQRFDRLLETVLSEGDLKCRVSEVVQDYDDEQFFKKVKAYNEWNENVFNRIQTQLDAYLNPTDRLTEQILSGSKSVGFRVPGDTFRPRVGDDDPLKRSLRSTTKEESFRQSFTENDSWPGDKSMNGDARKELARSRPVLEPELWEQLKLQATPYGHFAQVTEHGSCLKTSVKTRGFVPGEEDGVPTAGKRRTRWEHNNLGILAPRALEGEGRIHRTKEGGSSGALTQDHYRFDRGTRVTDTEFPLGKRMFPSKH